MWPILKSKKQILKEKETIYKLTSKEYDSEEGAGSVPDRCTFTNVNDAVDTYTVTFNSPVVGSSEMQGSVYYEGHFVINNLNYYINK